MGIHATAIVSPKARIGEDVQIGPFCIVEDEVEIGAGTVLDSHVVIKNYTTLGEKNHLYMGVVLGSDPLDKHFAGARSYLRIGNRNIWREYSTSSVGTMPESVTSIGDDNFIMVGVHVAHDCRVGNRTVLCTNASLAGYVEVDDDAFISGGVVIHQYSKIGRLAMVGGNTRVNMDVPPFLLTSDFNVAAKGLNLVGLRRAGIGRDVIRQLKEAYRILYRRQLPLREALARIEAEPPCAETREFVEFIRRSERGICRDRNRDTGNLHQQE